MNNLECAIAVLAMHREARRWTDEAVAADMCARLGLDPAGYTRVPGYERTDANPDALPDGPAVHETETRHYTDGSSATGTPPLPDQSPEQQAAAYRAQLDAALPPATEDAHVEDETAHHE